MFVYCRQVRNQKRLFIGQTDSQATGKVYWRKWVDHLYLSWWLHQIKKEKKSKQLSVRKCIVWVNRLRLLKSARINSLPVTQHEGKNVPFNSSFIGKSSVLCTIWQKLNKAPNCINLPRLNAVWSFCRHDWLIITLHADKSDAGLKNLAED